MKIVYCTDSICYAGGIQRITVAKANALADISGNEVYIIVTDNKKKPVLPVSSKIHLIDLGVNYFEDDWKSKLHVLKGIFVKRCQHKRKLERILNEIMPDVVISTGTSEKNFLPCLSIMSKPVFVREIHCAKNYRHLAADNMFEKILAYGGDFFDYHYHINQYDSIVVLTQEDKKQNWGGKKNVVVIPNPLTTYPKTESSQENNKVISVGRLVKQKNFSSLINAFKIVVCKHPDWILEIWGDGVLKNDLQALIDSYNLENNVFLKGYSYDIHSKMTDASIFVLSSTFEGFGLVIVEAMSCGLPVVSYACPCGPKDIITEGEDGFLVPVNDEQALADRMCYLIENEDRRKRMGANAKLTAENFKNDTVIQIWMNLFNKLRNSLI